MMNIKKILTIFLILMVLLPSVYAADTKTVDGAGKVDVSPSDTKPVTDDTKEKTTKITNKDKSIIGDIKVTTKDVSKFSVKKKSEYEISISKSGKHAKAKVSFPKSELQKIDIDKDGKFGLLHISDNGEVTHTTATEAELVAGKVMTFSTNIVNGYSGHKQYTFSDVESGDTLNIDDVSGNYTITMSIDDAPEYISSPSSNNISFYAPSTYASNNISIPASALNTGTNDVFLSVWVATGNQSGLIAKSDSYEIYKEGNKIWVKQKANDVLSQPSYLAVDDTYVYISDTYNNRIVKRYAGNLTYVSKIGSLGSGNDQFNYPRGIAVDDGYVYISDTYNHRIVKRYAGNLTYVNKIGSSGSGNDQFNYPRGIAVDDTYVYITDTYNHRIVKRYAGNLTHVNKIGSSGSGNDQFNYPQGIAVDDEYVYITDTYNHRIVKRYAGNLTYVSKIGSSGSGNDQFSSPRGIAVDNEYVYITDTGNHRIVKRYAGNLTYVSKIGSSGSGDDQFNSPQGIAVDDEYVYISDTGNHRIVKRYAGNLTYVSKIGSSGSGNDQFNSPRGIAVDNEYVYITDTGNYRIVKRYAGNLSYYTDIGNMWNTVLSSSLSSSIFNIGVYSQQTFPGCTLYIYINGQLDSTSADTSRWSYIEETQNMSFYIPTSISRIVVASSPSDRLQYLIGGIGIAGITNNAYSTPYNVASGVEKVLNTDDTCTGIEYVDTTGGTHDVTVTVYFTEDITVISDSHTATMQTVNISHTSANTAQDGELIPYDILDEYFGTIDFDTTNPNATITRNATNFMVDTGYITANTTYYYNVSIPNYVEEMVWSDWNPDNETCNAKVQIGNSTPYTTWNITTYNVTNGSLYKLVYASNGTEVGNATAANGSASIIILGLVDGVYWLTETAASGIFGFINVEAVEIVAVITTVVGGSFVGRWYRRKKKG